MKKLWEEATRAYVLEEDCRTSDGLPSLTHTSRIHIAATMAEESLFNYAAYRYLKSHPNESEVDIVMSTTKENIFDNEFKPEVVFEEPFYKFTLPFVHNVKHTTKKGREGQIADYLMRYTLNKLEQQGQITLIEDPAIVYNVYHNLPLSKSLDWDNINVKYMQDALIDYVIKNDSLKEVHPIIFNEIRNTKNEHIDMIVGPRNEIINLIKKD